MRKANLLPNMRNLGVNLRILIIVNTALALGAIVLSGNFNQFFSLISATSAIAQPMLLLSLLLLYACHSLLIKLRYWQGLLAMVLIVLFICNSVYELISQLLIFNDFPTQARVLFLHYLSRSLPYITLTCISAPILPR